MCGSIFSHIVQAFINSSSHAVRKFSKLCGYYWIYNSCCCLIHSLLYGVLLFSWRYQSIDLLWVSSGEYFRVFRNISCGVSPWWLIEIVIRLSLIYCHFLIHKKNLYFHSKKLVISSSLGREGPWSQSDDFWVVISVLPRLMSYLRS